MATTSAVDLIAVIPCREENLSRVKQLLDDYGEHVRAMDGAERFEVYQNRDSAEIIVLERYRDDAAFAEHLADPENATLNSELGLLTDGGSQLTFLTR